MKKGRKVTVEMGKVLTNLDGNEMTIPGDKPSETKPMTLGRIFTSALLHPKNENEKTSAETKLTRFELARGIHRAGPGSFALSGEQVEILKDLVNNIFSAIIVGQVYMYLAGTDVEEEEKDE